VGYCLALLLEEGEQLVHMFGASAEVDGIDAEPALAFEFGGGDPELAALFHATGHLGVQVFGLSFVQIGSAIANANG
jgi:hypothetical protein